MLVLFPSLFIFSSFQFVCIFIFFPFISHLFGRRGKRQGRRKKERKIKKGRKLKSGKTNKWEENKKEDKFKRRENQKGGKM